MVEQIRKISLELLDMVDLIVRQNVTNNLALSLYKKFLNMNQIIWYLEIVIYMN